MSRRGRFFLCLLVCLFYLFAFRAQSSEGNSALVTAIKAYNELGEEIRDRFTQKDDNFGYSKVEICAQSSQTYLSNLTESGIALFFFNQLLAKQIVLNKKVLQAAVDELWIIARGYSKKNWKQYNPYLQRMLKGLNTRTPANEFGTFFGGKYESEFRLFSREELRAAISIIRVILSQKLEEISGGLYAQFREALMEAGMTRQVADQALEYLDSRVADSFDCCGRRTCAFCPCNFLMLALGRGEEVDPIGWRKR